MTTLAQAVADARRQFHEAGLADAAIEARILIGGLLSLSNTEVFTGGDRVLSAHEQASVDGAVARRLKREPVHRILGRREFHGMDLSLSYETLEPRPDTEVLVDAMIPRLAALAAARGTAQVLDMGTGTGAILLALLSAVKNSAGTASDISADALQTAKKNAAALGLADRFVAMQSHWFDTISGRFDIIVSNPPYIRSEVIPSLEPEVRNFDPLQALDGGPDGLDAYRAIAQGAQGFLAPDGYVGVEIGYDQKEAVTSVFQNAGFMLVQSAQDYGGNDRVLVFTLNGS
ncbi:MAG: peptide chain release factor N(5)-glutamine methyltransferase [Neorhizobium sp.]|nr:peptide chain release factor N(5)-glutamine methyltransferase [Neorhizobium sp.]